MIPIRTLFNFILGFVLFTLPAAGFALDLVLAVPSAETTAGRALSLTILAYNSGDRPERLTLPAELAVRLQPADPGKAVKVSAAAESGAGEIEVAAGHFHKALYRLIIHVGPRLV